MRILALFVILVAVLNATAQCQSENWLNLTPLKSSRKDVERILGEPEKYFESYGTYQNEVGKFSIWYARGGCHKNVEGLQWNVPAKTMTRFIIFLNRALPLESYVNKVDLLRKESPGGYSRRQYVSPDESIIYETVLRKEGSEFVESITLQPAKVKQHLLCKEK